MKKVKQSLSYICLAMSYYISAQGIDKTVIASGGEALTNGEVHLNATIGEPFIGAVLTDFSIDQGFWAGSLLVEPMLPEEELGGIFVFPNPVEEQLNIFTNNNRVYGLTIFSLDGRRVYRKKVDASLVEHQIDASFLSEGVYLLQVLVEETSEEKLFKIIKR